MKSVIYICQNFSLGGAESFSTDLLAWLQQQGWRVEAYVTFPPYLTMLKQKGIKVHQLPIAIDIIGDWKGLVKAIGLFVPFLIQYAWLCWRVKDLGPILMSGFPEKLIVTWLARLTGQKVVWIEYGPLHTVLQKFGHLPKWLYQKTQNLPPVIIVPSTNTQKQLSQLMGIDSRKMRLIPCATNIKFNHNHKDRAPKKLAQKNQKNHNQIVCLSRLEKGKGQDILIQAMAIVKKTLPNIKLNIVGAMTDYGRELQTLSHQLHLQNNVHCTDYVRDVRSYIQQASVAVFPSVWSLEGFGLVMIEAMALGTPVIAFKIGPAPEILEQGRGGVVVSEITPSALAAAIISLLKNKKLRAKYSQMGQKIVAQKYRFDCIGPHYERELLRVSSKSI